MAQQPLIQIVRQTKNKSEGRKTICPAAVLSGPLAPHQIIGVVGSVLSVSLSLFLRLCCGRCRGQKGQDRGHTKPPQGPCCGLKFESKKRQLGSEVGGVTALSRHVTLSRGWRKLKFLQKPHSDGETFKTLVRTSPMRVLVSIHFHASLQCLCFDWFCILFQIKSNK